MAQKSKRGRPADLKAEIERLAAEKVRIVHVGIYDYMGTFRERRLKLEDVASVFHGDGTFVNVLPQWDAAESVFGDVEFVGEHVEIDPRSIRRYPFEPHACMMVADYAGDSAALSSRRLLQAQVDKAASMGFGVRAAMESEFFVLEEEATSLRDSGFSSTRSFARDNRCWAGESAATHVKFVRKLEKVLHKGGIDPLSLSLELGPGCFEITMHHADPVRAAEDHLAAKMFIKAFCRQKGLTASFMAQLGSGFPGLSQHPHVSLVDLESGHNVFHAGKSKLGMSKIFQHFIGGMMQMMPAGMPLTHHNPNSYRRHAPGNWAPKSASWARENYSAAIRVVTTAKDRCRLEYRLPGADANPYLNLAFILGAGLWGVENNCRLPQELAGGGPADASDAGAPLPHDLYSALRNLEQSPEAASIWGEQFLQHFVKAIRQEESAIRREVSAAERARYLEIV